jgi:hypothetical protein
MPNTVCALPGCSNLVTDAEVSFRRGFCQEHANEAVIDAMKNLGGYLEQLTAQAARVASSLEDRNP